MSKTKAICVTTLTVQQSQKVWAVDSETELDKGKAAWWPRSIKY